jgi:FkbM family methyltransferase
MPAEMTFVQGLAARFSTAAGRNSWLIRTMRPGYESLLDTATRGRGIEWEINGTTYRIDPRQRHRLAHNYEDAVADFMRPRVRPGSICLDVGANVGAYVLQFAHWSGPSGRVVAFEPNQAARRVLLRHVSLNGLSERVEIVPTAIAAACGEVDFFAADEDGMSRLCAPNELIADRVTRQRIQVDTLDRFCTSRGLLPDWIFIDIEGFEIMALEGARELISQRGNALRIIVEMHPSAWRSADTTRRRAEETLAELRMRPVALTGQIDPLDEHGQVYLERVPD